MIDVVTVVVQRKYGRQLWGVQWDVRRHAISESTSRCLRKTVSRVMLGVFHYSPSRIGFRAVILCCIFGGACLNNPAYRVVCS